MALVMPRWGIRNDWALNLTAHIGCRVVTATIVSMCRSMAASRKSPLIGAPATCDQGFESWL
ncbi:MAG TPA: hypothetical protein DDZ81_04865 [Acetobacteraceae bacterium]|nr:hypothetical protein [Acetobacteraceae bacterium]